MNNAVGFGLCGMPEKLLSGLLATGQKDLHMISSNAGTAAFGFGLLVKAGQGGGGGGDA